MARSPHASYFNVPLMALQSLPITSQQDRTSLCSAPQSSLAMLSVQPTAYCLASQIPRQLRDRLWATSRQKNRFVTFSHFGHCCLDKEEKTQNKLKNGVPSASFELKMLKLLAVLLWEEHSVRLFLQTTATGSFSRAVGQPLLLQSLGCEAGAAQ